VAGGAGYGFTKVADSFATAAENSSGIRWLGNKIMYGLSTYAAWGENLASLGFTVAGACSANVFH